VSRLYSSALTDLESRRGQVAMVAVAAGIAVVVVLNLVLPDLLADILVDRHGVLHPFSVQTFMWLAFSLGLGELIVRFQAGRTEILQLNKQYLPEDEKTVLLSDDLRTIYRRVRESPEADRCFLPRLIARCSLQFQASESVEQSASLLNTSSEMFLHEVDLRYSMIRYLCWVIPTLGFVGTVIGIGLALNFAGDPKNVDSHTLLTDITSRLAVSFNGTLVALLMAGVLVFLQHVAQAREEHALNNAAQYCLDNLINRLITKSPDRRP
jgi:biopolymer transport protein ExbB/TolQ